MKTFTLVSSTNPKAEKVLGSKKLILDIKDNLNIRITNAVSTNYLFSIRGISNISEDGNRITLTVGNDTYTFVKKTIPFFKVTAILNGKKVFKYLQAETSKEAIKAFFYRCPDAVDATCRELPIPQRFVEEVEQEVNTRLLSKGHTFEVYKTVEKYSSLRFSQVLHEELVEYINARMVNVR